MLTIMPCQPPSGGLAPFRNAGPVMDQRKPRILLLGATFSTNNMGVGTLTAGALQVLSSRYPNADVLFLDYGTEQCLSTATIEGRSLSLPLLNLRFSWKIFLPNNVALLLALATFLRFVNRQLRERLIQKNLWLRKIGEADLAVAVSGGDSFSDIYGLGRFFYVSLPQLLVLALGRRLILLPQTIGPFRTRLSRSIATSLMRHAELVYSRDVEGVCDARGLLRLSATDPKVRFSYDLGFVVEPRRPVRLDLGQLNLGTPRGRPLVGLNVSGLLLMGGYNGRNPFRLIVDYRALILKLIEFLIVQKGADVLLVPHVFGNQGESDSIATRSTYDELKDKFEERLFCVRGHYDQNEIKYIIGFCDFFIGSRMHSCIAALSQSIPSVAIAYSKKFIGVFQSIGAEHLVADPRKLTIEEILSAVDKAFIERQAIKSRLDDKIPGVRKQVLSVLTECA